MPLWKKLLYGFVLANLIAMAIITFVLPGIIRDKAIEWVETNTERSLSIEVLRLNPLNWETSVEGLVLTEPDSTQPFATFKQLSFHVSPRSVWEFAPVITGLELESPKVSLVRMIDGSFNYADFMTGDLETVKADKVEAAEEPARFALNNLVVRDGEFTFTDQSKPQVIHTIRDFEMALPFIGNTSALADRFVEPHLSMRVDDAPIVATGEVKPFAKTLDTSLELALNNIDLPFYTAYLPNVRKFKIDSGHLSLDLKLSYRVRVDEVPELMLDGSAALSALRVRDQRDKDLFFLPLARVTLERAALFSKEIVISAVDIYGLELFVDRGRDGVWNHAQLANDPAFKVASSDEKKTSQPEDSPPPKVTIDAFRLRDGKLHFHDQTERGEFEKKIHTINLDLDSISLEPENVSPFALSMIIEEGEAKRNGRMKISGDLSLQPFNLIAKLEGRKIQLVGTEVYRPRMLSAYFASGHIDTDLELHLKMINASPVVKVNGEIGIRGLRVREPVLKSDILAWENLQLSGLELKMASGPPSLHLSEVVLNNFQAKVLVTGEGQVNLQHAITHDEDGEGADSVEEMPKQQTAETADASEPGPEIRIDTIVLQGGSFSFADEHLKRPFRSKLTKLGGRISGLDSTDETPADVDLRASLNGVSPLKITGGLNPFGAGLFADFKISFEGIDLTQVTPYSGTYLGYTIKKGKLYLDLDYKIDGAQLVAGNKVFLDQFTFGDSVESDKATGLPVKLAIALLKDRQGEIHLELPVSGSLDDPQFSIVGVTFTIIKNLLVKAITSPFALLSSLIGGGEDFSAIYFEHGSAELSQAEQEKMTKLVAALQERPGLRVEVSGYIDAENDPEGYRRVSLEKNILESTGKKPGTVLTGTQRSRALKKVYRAADFPKPRNAFGLVKGLPDAEMEKLILANSQAGEDEMQELAEQRAKRVVDNLILIQGLPPERVFFKRDDIYSKGDAEAGQLARAGFGVGVD